VKVAIWALTNLPAFEDRVNGARPPLPALAGGMAFAIQLVSNSGDAQAETGGRGLCHGSRGTADVTVLMNAERQAFPHSTPRVIQWARVRGRANYVLRDHAPHEAPRQNCGSLAGDISSRRSPLWKRVECRKLRLHRRCHARA
jgi:hypothetical protein